jgi:hypothetical protein
MLSNRIKSFSSENSKKLHKNEQFHHDIRVGEIFVLTPQMLIDCVLHRYIAMDDVALLVFDDAVKCQRKEPTHSVMKDFFNSCAEKPHVLGFIANYAALRPMQEGFEIYSKHQLLHIASNMHSQVISCEEKSESEDQQLCHFDIHYFTDVPREYDSVVYGCRFSLESLVASFFVASKMLKSTEKIISCVITNLEVLGLWCALKYLEIEINLHQSVMVSNGMQPYPPGHILRRFESILKDFLDKCHPGVYIY